VRPNDVGYTPDAGERKNANLRIDLGAASGKLLMRLCTSRRPLPGVKLDLSNLAFSSLLKL
jgi:hypothetical protein